MRPHFSEGHALDWFSLTCNEAQKLDETDPLIGKVFAEDVEKQLSGELLRLVYSNYFPSTVLHDLHKLGIAKHHHPMKQVIHKASVYSRTHRFDYVEASEPSLLHSAVGIALTTKITVQSLHHSMLPEC